MTQRRRWPLLALLAPSVAALFSGTVGWAAGHPPVPGAAPASDPDADQLRRLVAEQASTVKRLRASVRQLVARVQYLRKEGSTARLQVRRTPALEPAPSTPSHPVPRAVQATPAPPRRAPVPAPARRSTPRSTPKATPKPAPTRPKATPTARPKPAPKPAPQPAPPPAPPEATPPPVPSTGS